METASETWLLTPGLVAYREAWEAQRALAAARAAGRIPDCLILLQHPHTFTLGRRADPANVLADEVTLARLGIEVVAIDRGGDVTYHGPGQWVGYPILDITPRGGDALRYLHDLEDVQVMALRDFGIEARPGREVALTGAWVGDDKIAAIGVKVSRGITQHGFALNVATDLRFFDLIVPCGIRDKGVTSMEKVLGRPAPMEEVARALARAFEDVFGARLRPFGWHEALARAGQGAAEDEPPAGRQPLVEPAAADGGRDSPSPSPVARTRSRYDGVAMAGPDVRVKRVYDPPSSEDGRRVLVDRLWPRGLSRETAAVDEWLRDIAPSDELRRWFGHAPERWPEFRRRYLAELEEPAKAEAFGRLLELARSGRVTLLFAAKDEAHNNAVALAEVVRERSGA